MSPAAPAAERLRRLLAMIPWVVTQGGAPLEEIASRFGITTDQAVRDLEQASLIGLPPYTPDRQIEIIVDDDWVAARPGPVFLRPQRFTAAEGFAILTAGRALQSLPGADASGPLARALDKLQAVLGDQGELAVDVDRPAHLEEVRRAAAEGHQLHIEYYAAWRDELTSRDVDPYVVFLRDGRWYLDAYCHLVDGVRHFRVDRIRSAAPTGQRFERRPTSAPESVYEPAADATTAVLDLPADARWVVETYPCQWSERDGRLLVTLSVTGTTWLERLLLRVGPQARVLEPPQLAGVGADAARRLLARYQA
ncbi:MAG: WYL domain-containing protein [Actinomycetota bacterium]|nr:WYL domain-containing protein [Actinomycetota bacterium]